jgi:hypothetical protein
MTPRLCSVLSRMADTLWPRDIHATLDELAELRDRAVTDAREITRLRSDLWVAQADNYRLTETLTAAEAEVHTAHHRIVELEIRVDLAPFAAAMVEAERSVRAFGDTLRKAAEVR